MLYSNKKGEGTAVAYWFFWILFGSVAVSIIITIIVSLHNSSISQAAKIPENIEDELVLAARFYNSDDCFAYKDDIGRVHPKIINATIFNQGNLTECFLGSNVKYAFRLILEQPLSEGVYGPIWTFNTEPIKTFNWVDEGDAAKEISEDVWVLHGNQKYKGVLRIQIQNVK
ncbi:MAG: hypothetical protein V1831_04300 [Candidatus Woesearchaeota archaeon]